MKYYFQIVGFFFLSLTIINCKQVIENSKGQNRILKIDLFDGLYVPQNFDCNIWFKVEKIGNIQKLTRYEGLNKIGSDTINFENVPDDENLIYFKTKGFNAEFHKEDTTVYIQNYGNSINDYSNFPSCDLKYLIFKNLGNSSNIHFNDENSQNVNDYGYFFEQTGNYQEAVTLLNSLIKKFPDRVVAYLNLADAYWGLGELPDAKLNYQKYVELMTSQGKDLNKIPPRVNERIY